MHSVQGRTVYTVYTVYMECSVQGCTVYRDSQGLTVYTVYRECSVQGCTVYTGMHSVQGCTVYRHAQCTQCTGSAVYRECSVQGCTVYRDAQCTVYTVYRDAQCTGTCTVYGDLYSVRGEIQVRKCPQIKSKGRGRAGDYFVRLHTLFSMVR